MEVEDLAGHCKRTFELPEILEDLGTRDYLYKPEQLIFNMLKDKLPNMTMFEIGVGGGRLTKFFAPIVKKFFGIDYVPSMIDICRTKFPHLSFKVFDIRDLDSSKHYDFVLFGLNGIDYMSIEDRIKVLKIIYTITNKIFCFSAHIKIDGGDYIVKKDPSKSKIMTMYINPVYQYKMLEEIGYKNIRVFDLSGKEITNNTTKVKDSWVYYLCDVKNKKE